jgi:hypothetical protein
MAVVSFAPRPLYDEKKTNTHWTGGWVGPKTGFNNKYETYELLRLIRQ